MQEIFLLRAAQMHINHKCTKIFQFSALDDNANKQINEMKWNGMNEIGHHVFAQTAACVDWWSVEIFFCGEFAFLACRFREEFGNENFLGIFFFKFKKGFWAIVLPTGGDFLF